MCISASVCLCKCTCMCTCTCIFICIYIRYIHQIYIYRYFCMCMHICASNYTRTEQNHEKTTHTPESKRQQKEANRPSSKAQKRKTTKDICPICGQKLEYKCTDRQGYRTPLQRLLQRRKLFFFGFYINAHKCIKRQQHAHTRRFRQFSEKFMDGKRCKRQ
jgi:hypothetical protein